MNATLLMVIFILFFFFTFFDIVRKDIFFGVIYFILFLYSIFTQIGYVFFPELSIAWGVYFGPNIIYEYINFLILSFLTFYLSFKLIYKPFLQKSYYDIATKKPTYMFPVFCLLIIAHILYLFSSYIIYYDFLSYSNVQEAFLTDELGIHYFIFYTGFQVSVYIILVLYITYRLRHKIKVYGNSILHVLFLLAEIVLFLAIAIKSGNRNLLAALLMGILLFEYGYISIMNLKKVLSYILVIVIILGFFVLIEYSRVENSSYQDAPIYAHLIQKDYFFPSHMLLAAIDLNYVDIFEVMKSNFSNSLIKLNYPYLQSIITDLLNPGIATRSQSMAFYIFTEGYIAFGFLGFFYNGIFILGLLMIWRIMSLSKNYYYNLFILSLISTQIVNVVRSQSSYLVKDMYIFFIPTAVLFYCVTGMLPTFSNKNLIK